MKKLIAIVIVGLITSSAFSAMWINLRTKMKIDGSMLPQTSPMTNLVGEALWRSWGFEPLTPEIQAQLDAEAAAEAARIAEEKRIADEAEAARIAIEAAKAARLALVTEWIKLDSSSRMPTAQMPRTIGQSFNCGVKQWVANGWRGICEIQPARDGYTILTTAVEDIDGTTCRIVTATDRLTSEIEAEVEAARQEAIIADLTANAKQYVLENCYLMICDQITQTNTHAKISAEEMAARTIALSQTDAVAGAKVEKAYSFVNQALTYYDTKWWDRVKYRDVPALVQGAQTLLGLQQ